MQASCHLCLFSCSWESATLQHRGGDPWNYQQLSWTHLLFRAEPYKILLSRSLDRLKFPFQNSRAVILLCPLFSTLRILYSSISWSMQPRLSQPWHSWKVLPCLLQGSAGQVPSSSPQSLLLGSCHQRTPDTSWIACAHCFPCKRPPHMLCKWLNTTKQ